MVYLPVIGYKKPLGARNQGQRDRALCPISPPYRDVSQLGKSVNCGGQSNVGTEYDVYFRRLTDTHLLR